MNKYFVKNYDHWHVIKTTQSPTAYEATIYAPDEAEVSEDYDFVEEETPDLSRKYWVAKLNQERKEARLAKIAEDLALKKLKLETEKQIRKDIKDRFKSYRKDLDGAVSNKALRDLLGKIIDDLEKVVDRVL